MEGTLHGGRDNSCKDPRLERVCGGTLLFLSEFPDTGDQNQDFTLTKHVLCH